MPISALTLDKMRNSGMQVVIPTYNYWPAEVVASGLITNTPTEYPIGQVGVNWTGGDFNDVELGQLWIIRSGDELVSYGVARASATSSTLEIDGKSRGDAGIAVTQAFAITEGHQITVYSMKPLWSLLSRIIDGEFFKQFDRAYAGEGANPAPVVNMGSWRQDFADEDTGLAEFTFDASSSFAWLDKTITGYSYTLPSGAVVTGGSTSSSSVTFTLPQGFHLVKLTLTDSGGATASGTRPVWVNGDSFPTLNEQFAFEISGDSQDRVGRGQSVTFIGDMPSNDDYLPGMGIFYSEKSYYDGDEITDGSLVENFAGFASEEMRVHDLVGGLRATSFEVFGPWQWMEMIPMVSQAIVEVSSPAAWTDIAPGLGIPQFIGWYVLKHHSTFLDLFDYDFFYDTNPNNGDDDNERKLNWGLNGSTLAEYVAYAGRVIAGNMGCLSDGTLALRRDPSVETTNFRNALDELMTITVDEDSGIMDVSEPIEIPRKFFNEVGQLRVFTLSYTGTDTTAYGSIAPGYTQMQAPGSQDEDSYIVKPDNGIDEGFVGFRPFGQDKTNRLSGMLLAKANNPIPEISLSLVRNMDFFEPADMKWVRLSIPSGWSPRGETVNTRAVPLTVDRSWEEAEGGAFVKVITMTVEPETFGQPGETYDLDKGGGETYAPIIPPVGILDPPELELTKKAGFLVGINQNGRLGRTKNANNWSDIQGNIASIHADFGGIVKFQDITFDFYSEYVASGFVEGALGAWVAVLEEFAAGSGSFDNLKIWKTDDVLAQNVVWTQQYEVAGSSDMHESVRLIANPDLQNYAACLFHTDNGNFLARTTDGSSWFLSASGETVLDNSAGAVNEPVDFGFLGQAIVASGWNIADQKYKLTYFSTPAGGSSFVSSSPDSDVPWPFIEAELRGTRVYATQVIQNTITTSPALSESISEDPPETSFGFAGTKTPVRNTTYSGGLSSSDLDFYIRGDPDSGFLDSDPEPPLVAGYHDEDRVTPVTSICGPATLAEYLRDDGWLFNSDDFDPNITSEPTNAIKFKIDIRIKGTANFDTGGMSGFYTFTDVSTSFVCIALSIQIGSHVCAVELYNKRGVLVQAFQAIVETDSDGWGVSADRAPSISASGNSSTNSILSADEEASDDISRIIIRYVQGGSGLNYMMPLTKSWNINFEEITVEDPTLWRITNISGTPSYTDVTAVVGSREFTPRNPYAVAIDTLDDTALVGILEETAGGGYYIGQSSTSGSTWTVDTDDQTALYGIRLSGGFGLAWGLDKLLLSEDGFLSSQSVLGDWTDVIDSGGLFRVLKGTGVPEY